VTSLGLAGAPNARDLGGLPVGAGRRVRGGVLLRTGALGRLADDDVAALARLGLKVVVDLRHDSEIRLAPPDRLPAGIRTRHIPLFDADHPMFTYLAAVLLGRDDAGYPGLEIEGTPDAMTAVYRWFVADAGARRSLGAAVRVVADAAGAPVLFHCSAGKDRTGWLTAILLTALGADEDTIRADYLASNDFARAANAALVARRRARGLRADPAVLGPVLEAREDYLAAAYDEVARRYGDMDGYLRDGLGLDEGTRTALRGRLTSAR